MRRRVWLAFSAATLAALVACASSDEQGASLEPFVDGGSTVIDDAGPGEPDATPGKGDASLPLWGPCNDHGWCETELPDPNLTFIDVRPFADRAFAVAESDTLGTKVLEWTDAKQAWVYIDDNSQNAYDSGAYAGKMFAPSENELYYTTAPGIVYHGTRASVSSPFTWESTRLPYSGPRFEDRDPGRTWRLDRPGWQPRQYTAALGVTGTSAGDVYAWYGNRIFRRQAGADGGSEWVSDFASEDADAGAEESFYIFNATPGEGDEIWFIGSRGVMDSEEGLQACPTLYRKTSAGWSTVLDATYANDACTTKPGAIPLTLVVTIPGLGTLNLPFTQAGWATSIASVGPGQVIFYLQNTLVFFYVDTTSRVARYNYASEVDPPVEFHTPRVHSVERVGDQLWASGHGFVFGSEIKPSAWLVGLGTASPEFYEQQEMELGAELETTSVAMKGRFLDEPLYQVRGTSKNNLWAVGNRYALHKKTP